MTPRSLASRGSTPRLVRPPAAALCLVLAAATCRMAPDRMEVGTAAAQAPLGGGRVAVIAERFITPFDSADNIDGPGVWHGPDGQHWLLSTAKSTDVVLVNDAATGAAVRRVGGTGRAAGRLARPNGIAVIGDVALVVERDNHRVQGFRLPDFTPLGTFGDTLLRLPYGVGWYEDGRERYVVYVTDNYETADERTPPDRELGGRVKQFLVTLDAHGMRAAHVRTFGDTAGAGVLRVVESITPDAPNDRLLIAEETETDSHVKVYDLRGRFTGRVFGRGYFPQQAEGLALYACRDGTGYWIATDQGDRTNTYHVFDRTSLAHVGAFTGATTRRTDGVALTQRRFGPFTAGAFYASHLDGSVGAMAWADVAVALRLRGDCVR